MPSDIDLQSGFRLPLPKREDLDAAGKRTFDRGNTPGANIAGLRGPAGIQLYSTKTAEHLTAIKRAGADFILTYAARRVAERLQ